MAGDFLGFCEVAKSCIKDGLDLVLPVRFVRFLKYGELQKKICFLTEGGFLIKIRMFVKNCCIY